MSRAIFTGFQFLGPPLQNLLGHFHGIVNISGPLLWNLKKCRRNSKLKPRRMTPFWGALGWGCGHV
jgi:hypothetical protein